MNKNIQRSQNPAPAKRSRLARSLLLIVLTLYLGVLVVLAGIELSVQYLAKRQAIRQDVVTSIQSLAPVISQQMWYLDLSGLENTATALLSNSAVSSVELNSIFADIQIQKGQQPKTPLIRKASQNNSDDSAIQILDVRTADDQRLVEFHFAINFEDRVIGNGSIYSNEGTILSSLKTSFLSSFLSTLTQITVLSLVFYLLMVKLVTRPISFLANTLRQSLLQDENQRRKTESLALRNDELGDLFKNYLQLMLELENKDKEVHAYQNELEHRVGERTKELKLALQQLEKNQQLRQDFLAYMSHEIRNPINAIIGLTEMLRDSGIRKEQESLVRTMVNSSQSLLDIINDILDFSKLEAGKVTLEQIEFNLRDVVDDCLLLISSQAFSKNIFLATYVQADLPGTVRGDPTRLRQILINLLSNAVKFTDQGEIVVRITSPINNEHRDNEVRLLIEVKDTGMGIPRDAQQNLFQAFQQADQSTTRTHGGTGLGLAICKQFVEMMQGEIDVSSMPGQGSTFWFTCWLGYKPAASQRHQLAMDNLRDKSLLIVVNRHELASTMAQVSHYFQLQPRVVTRLSDARDILANRQFDFLIVANELPDGHGIDFLQEENCLNQVTYRLLINSNQPFLQDVQRVRECCDLFINQPYSNTFLIDGFLTLLGLAQSSTQLAEKHEQDNSAMEFSGLSILVAEDSEVNRMVMKGLLKKLNINASFAINGQEAFEAVERLHPDIILMDCEMPTMNGYIATKKIREQEAQKNTGKRTAIFALTAHTDEESIQKALDAGMDGYLSKPLQLRILVEKLTEYTSTSHQASD